MGEDSTRRRVFPKPSKEAHVRENRAALDLKLTDDDYKERDRVFHLPSKKVALQIR